MALPSCLWRSDNAGGYLALVGSSNAQLGVTSPFGKNIESLPGLTRNDIYAITDSDFATGKAFFQDKVQFSLSELVADMTEWVLPKFRLEAVLDRPHLGQLKTGTQQYWGLSATPVKRGIIAERKWSDDYGMLTIESVTVLCNTSGSARLFIEDNITGITQYSFTAIAGQQVRVITNFNSTSTEVKIYTYGNLINQGKVDVSKGCTGCGEETGKQWKLRGWDGSNYANDTYGLEAQFVYRCDQGLIACMFVQTEAFQQAALYELGANLLREWIRPERANPKTLRTEKAMELLADFEDRKEKRLENLRETVTAMMARPRSGCISSNSTRFTQTSRKVFGSWR